MPLFVCIAVVFICFVWNQRDTVGNWCFVPADWKHTIFNQSVIALLVIEWS